MKPPHFPWPIITPETEAAVIRQLHRTVSIYDRSGIIEEFESEFARRHKIPFALTTSSGTAALHSAFFALGIGPGSKVLCPNYTFLATVTPLMSLGAQPIFCDSDADGNLDPNELEKYREDDIAAVVVTHMWGLPSSMPAIHAFCRRSNIRLIEDCSHAHGATVAGQSVGTFADIAVWSLQGQKTITGGEGGILLTSHRDVYERATLFGHYNKRCFQEVPATSSYADMRLTGFGLKLRAHPLAIAIAGQQLEHLDEWLKQREEFATEMRDVLKRYPFIRPQDLCDRTSSWYRLCFTVDPERISAARVLQALRAEGATEFDGLGSTQPLSGQALFQEPWRAFPWYQPETYSRPDPKAFPHSIAYHNNSIRLPMASRPCDRTLMEQYLAALDKVLGAISAGALS
jgi:dTDP-4-amino-4,6-dideoxygalactose transaminase